MQVQISKGAKIGILIAAIITGILFCCLGIELFRVLFTIVGAMMVLGAVYSFVRKNIFIGVLGLIFGTLLIVLTWTAPNVVYIIFGVMMLLSGIAGFIVSVMNEDARSCITSVLNAVLGGFLIGYHEGADWMVFTIGALFIVLGIIGIILVLIPNKNHGDKKVVKTVDVKEVKNVDPDEK